ncbi:UbiA prenyltransferase family [Xylaria castorea]|nr:UbiA prenyltransferase family [Xylaria castorea]
MILPWLFTVNDFKTMIFPSIAVARFYCLGYLSSQISVFVLLSLLTYLFCWTWANLLAFIVSNQRYQAAIFEDPLNKPWLPIPAGRISSWDAQILGLLVYLLAILMSEDGGLIQSILLVVFEWAYNHPGASSRELAVSNLLNALGFTSFAFGVLDVTLEHGNVLSWLCLLVAMILTTVHSQDLYWSSGSVGYQLTGSLALLVACRTLLMRTVTEDRVTFLIYNGWLVSIYKFPF